MGGMSFHLGLKAPRQSLTQVFWESQSSLLQVAEAHLRTLTYQQHPNWLTNKWLNKFNLERRGFWKSLTLAGMNPREVIDAYEWHFSAADPGAVYHLISIRHLRCMWNLQSDCKELPVSISSYTKYVTFHSFSRRFMTKEFLSKVYSYAWNVDEGMQSRLKLLRVLCQLF